MSEKSKLYEDGAKPKLLSRQFSFTEGPVPDKDGNVYFTDQPNNEIWRYSVDGALSLFTNNSFRANGMYIDNHGNIVACADQLGQLVSFDPTAEPQVLLDNVKGLRMNGPNDLWIDASNGIYFTDPYYGRNYWPEPKPVKHKESVYYLPPGKKEAIVVADDLVKPNGIIGTPDGKELYVADIGGAKIFKYKIGADGLLQDKTLFTDMGSDGMTLDEQGNVYLTGKGVTIFNKEGKRINHLPIDEDWTANICFGGRDHQFLFITASKGIYGLQMMVRGMR